jgi:hypothetical protein
MDANLRRAVQDNDRVFVDLVTQCAGAFLYSIIIAYSCIESIDRVLLPFFG